jgi:hypothetical protein
MCALPPELRQNDMPGPPFGDAFVLACGVLMTLASALVLLVDPWFALLGLLMFGGSTIILESTRRARLAERTRARLSPFVSGLRRGNADGFRWLLTVLAKLDGRHPGARRRALVALKTIAENERLLDGLIFHSRHGHVDLAVFSRRLSAPGASSLVAALASLHPDGHIREAAVRAMARRLRPAHLPFLLERAVDWFPQVRTLAQTALRFELARRPALLPQARSAYARIARRAHAAQIAQVISDAQSGRP